MTIQKEHLEEYKKEKLEELENVDSNFRCAENQRIDEKIELMREEMLQELEREIVLKKTRIQGEIAAIDKIIAKIEAPEAEQL